MNNLLNKLRKLSEDDGINPASGGGEASGQTAVVTTGTSPKEVSLEKEYLGVKGDVFYYIDKMEDGKFQVLDAADAVVFPKEGDEAPTDYKEFIVDAVKTLDMEEISTDLVFKHDLLDMENKDENRPEDVTGQDKGVKKEKSAEEKPTGTEVETPSEGIVPSIGVDDEPTMIKKLTEEIEGKLLEEVTIVSSDEHNLTLDINGVKYKYETLPDQVEKFKKMYDHGAKFRALHWLKSTVPPAVRLDGQEPKNESTFVEKFLKDVLNSSVADISKNYSIKPETADWLAKVLA